MSHRGLRFERFGPPEEVLKLATLEPEPPERGATRVRMRLAPVNPSDLIPITGAYAHRLRPPLIAGYEGVGTVLEASDTRVPVGTRVLPLRGDGTWQEVVSAPSDWLVPVPDDIPDEVAARAYINPLAALMMLRTWPTAGRHVILTAAGSDCARLMAHWAQRDGAASVTGICRSHVHAQRLAAAGVRPIFQDDSEAVTEAARRCDLVFDAVGGELATAMLAHMRAGTELIAYGLLSGRNATIPATRARPRRFHLREHTAHLTPPDWQALFKEMWPLFRGIALSPPAPYPLAEWREALKHFARPARQEKPVLVL